MADENYIAQNFIGLGTRTTEQRLANIEGVLLYGPATPEFYPDADARALNAFAFDVNGNPGLLDLGSLFADVEEDLATALALKANIASPTFTGTPAVPTASPGTNTTQAASTAFVTAAAALKADLASPTFTGVPAGPTATAGTSTTQFATTAFVTTADNLKAPLASPTFTGTPAVPTAAEGTSTTQAASTEFVANEIADRTVLLDNHQSGLRETLATLYSATNLRRRLATFRIPAAYAVEGTYKIEVVAHIVLRINSTAAPAGCCIGFVTDDRLTLGAGTTVGNVYGVDLAGFAGATYVFHNLCDYISLGSEVVEGEEMLYLSDGFSAPSAYSKLPPGADNTNGIVVMEDLSFGSERSYLTPGEDFNIHLVLDCPQGTAPSVSYLASWDATVKGYVYPGP